MDIKEKLIAAGVKNLKAYGYPHASADNILTDRIYSSFFRSMLNDNTGHTTSVDAAIAELLAEISKRGA